MPPWQTGEWLIHKRLWPILNRPSIGEMNRLRARMIEQAAQASAAAEGETSQGLVTKKPQVACSLA